MNNLGTTGTITLDTSSDWDNLTELEQLATEYSDYYKEAHGVRPRHDISDWTVENFKAEFESLAQICEENRIMEAAAEAEAAIEVEATIARLIVVGAGDRETAIRWMLEAEQTNDADYLCYHFGLPFGYFSRVVQ